MRHALACCSPPLDDQRRSRLVRDSCVANVLAKTPLIDGITMGGDVDRQGRRRALTMDLTRLDPANTNRHHAIARGHVGGNSGRSMSRLICPARTVKATLIRSGWIEHLPALSQRLLPR